MEEKKTLAVNNAASRKVGKWQAFFAFLGWACFVIGIIVAIIGVLDYSHGEAALIAGLSVFISSFVLLFNAALLRGLEAIVESSEYNKAVIEENYNIE